MNTKLSSKYKQGATSIYVVVIATLLFSVITVSFIRIILNEANRTTSDELAQSAYDSALAGVEDTKVALKKYYDCKAANNTSEGECATVYPAVYNGFQSSDPSSSSYGNCDAISHALGRISSTTNSEVLVKETNGTGDGEGIVQAYTCVMIDNTLDDYIATLHGNSVRVVPLKTDNPSAVTGIRIFWYSESDDPTMSLNFGNKNNFPSLSGGVATPPTLSAQVIQTAPSYSLDQLVTSVNGTTDRGTIIFTPTDEGNNHHVPVSTFVASNDHASTNNPYKVRCGKPSNNVLGLSDEFACVASIELSSPVGSSERNKDTFLLALSLPYGQPTTTFAVQLCTDTDTQRGDCLDASGNLSIAKFVDAQIAVDSTGRANDMYSRVEARLEFYDPGFPFPEFALQATSTSDDSIKKNFYVTDNCWKTTADGSIEPCSNTGEAN